MAGVNKIALRQELDFLKSEFSRLSSANKVAPESLVLFKAMFVIIEVMVTIFLEKQTKKDRNNSSIPSSQTTKDESSIPKGTQGNGKKENGHVFSNSRTRESRRFAKVHSCNTCGEDLEDRPCDGHERRTKIDIIFEKVVSHVDAEVKTCPNCDGVTKGRFPSDMLGPVQYGLGVKAYILNLLIAQMISLKRIQKSIKTLIGQTISQATILKYVLQLSLALEPWEKSCIKHLLYTSSIHVDETSLRVDKKNYWLHVYSSGDITLKFLHHKRGKEAIEDIDIIPRYQGVIIHDCWASYLSYENCEHGLCGSHLLRELKFVIDAHGYSWAANMKNLLQETCAKVSRRKKKKLSEKEYKNLQKRYRNILTRGEKELPPIPERRKGQRGKIAKSDAHNLLERLRTYEQSVLLFSTNPDVSFTNNRAERDLRMDKVKQKVAGCFRKDEYAKAYCRISSYLCSMANKGYNPLVAIQIAMNGQLYSDQL